MAFMKTNSVDIIVGGVTKNSLTDYGLAIENTDYIGTPEQNPDSLVFVPGRSGPLDFTDAVFGGQYFQFRPIIIKFGGIENPEDWDTVISEFRNAYEGRIVKLVFATDPDWYYTGRCSIQKFKHERALGTFTFALDYADPYKYKEIEETVAASGEGVSVSCPVTRKQCVPEVTSENSITITYNGDTFSFDAGTHKDPGLVLTEGTNTLTVTGSGNVTISYLDGSL